MTRVRRRLPRRFALPANKGSGIAIHKPGVYNNAAGEPVVPDKWTKQPRFQLRDDLHNARKKEPIPHMSFDIDGDGVVSQLDYFYAKQARRAVGHCVCACVYHMHVRVTARPHLVLPHVPSLRCNTLVARVAAAPCAAVRP